MMHDMTHIDTIKNCWQEPVYPRPLQKGMTIAFTAPASATNAEEIEVLRNLWQKEGYAVIFGDSCKRRGLYGGTPEEQAEELNRFMTEDCCDAVFAMRGGYGTMRYLEQLDYDGIRTARKPFVGYSDCTALHTAFGRKSGLVTYHAPMGVDQVKYSAEDHQALVTLLQGRTRVIEPLPEPPRGNIKAGGDTGVLYGGNLTLLAALSGTPYGLTSEMLKGNYLFIEEIGEPPYRIDRMLQQLRLQGWFAAVEGVALGNFKDCDGDEDEMWYDVGGEILRFMAQGHEVDEEYFVFYLPTGHGTPHRGIPLGSEISYRSVSNSMICLPYCEA